MNPKNLIVLADLTKSFAKIKEKCESGINPVLTLLNDKVVVRFDVRTASKGVRKFIGSYYSYEAAVEAKWGFKKSGLTTSTLQEKEALKELAIVSRAGTVIDDLPELAPSLLDALLSVLPPHEILAEDTLELLSPIPEEASRGVKYKVSASQQSQWLATQFSKYDTPQQSSSATNSKEQENSSIMDCLEKHIELPSGENKEQELSDEEYNKLLGLDD